MKKKEAVLAEFRNKPENTLVMIGPLYREKFSGLMSEVAYAKIISRLCKNGEIVRVSKGIYCCPRETRFGTILPSESEIVNLYTAESNGMVVGYALYNSLGLTTQVSKHQTVYSSKAEEKIKRIGNVTIFNYEIEYTSNVKAMIQLMELLRNYEKIQDLNKDLMIRAIERLSKQYNESTFEVVQKSIRYPKWTIAFLREVLNFYHIPNNLNKYLSSLSNYMIPRMEEFHATA